MKIVGIVFPNMTPLDLIGPMSALAALPGAQLQYAWKTKGPVATDCGTALIATHSFAETVQDPDILIIGGAGAATLDAMNDKELLAYLSDRGARARWLVSVCTGSLVLAAAGLLRGYKAASHWAVREHLALFGAEPVADRIVIDRNRMTGGGVTAGVDIGIALAGKLVGDDFGRFVELMFEYAPQPPYGTGRPELAGDTLTQQTLAMLNAVLPPEQLRTISQANARP